MARQIGIIKVTGLIDGISYYQSPWGLIARRKGGASKERIQTAPEFENVRKHNSEFGDCAKAGAFLRQALAEYWFEKRVHERAGHFLKVMSDLMKFDTVSTYGNRRAGIGMGTAEGKAYLQGKVLEGHCKLADVFPKNPVITVDSSSFTIKIDLSKGVLKYPRGATHIQISLLQFELDLDARTELKRSERETTVGVDEAFVLIEQFAVSATGAPNRLLLLRFAFFRSDYSGNKSPVQDVRWRHLGILSAF